MKRVWIKAVLEVPSDWDADKVRKQVTAKLLSSESEKATLRVEPLECADEAVSTGSLLLTRLSEQKVAHVAGEGWVSDLRAVTIAFQNGAELRIEALGGEAEDRNPYLGVELT